MSYKQEFMDLAYKESIKAFNENEVPVGAVIVKDGEVISYAHNLKNKNNNPTHHAEMLAIEMACDRLNNWRLNNCEIYITLEPCCMCASAIAQSRISTVYIGYPECKMGAAGTVLDILNSKVLGHKTNVVWNCEERHGKLLSDFFNMRR